MSESATDVIVSRSRRSEPLGPMVVVSVAGHAVGVVALVMLAAFAPEPEPVRPVMMISLNAGAPGPVTGGLTEIGGREVKEVAPPEAIKRPEPPPPPAPPKMSLPAEKPKPAPKTEARKTTPAPEPQVTKQAGPEITKGSTPVDTGARGTGFGASSAGGSGAPQVSLDGVTDFCCNEYLLTMVELIRARWDKNQGGARGTTMMKFTIYRDGRIDNVEIEKSSNLRVLDLAAQRALLSTKLPQLPSQYTNQTLTVHVRFDYD